MPRLTISIAIFLGCVDAVTLSKSKITAEPDAYSYNQSGHEPSYWHDMQSDPFFANTWRFSGEPGHVV